MKSLLFLILLIILFNEVINAQYRENKTIYDYHGYSYQPGDPYNPSTMALGSFLMPGLGEILEGEGARGFPFFFGSLSLSATKFYLSHYVDMNYTNTDVMRKSIFFTQIGLRIWSAIDASRIAKVNNQAFRCKYNQKLIFQVLPYCEINDNYGLAEVFPSGIKLLVTF